MPQESPEPGARVEGVVVAYEPFGLIFDLGDHGVAVADLAQQTEDDIDLSDANDWPALGSRVVGKVLGRMPSGQLRITIPRSDIV